jgi:hypothetical protein
MGKKKVLVKIQPEGKYGESPSFQSPLHRPSFHKSATSAYRSLDTMVISSHFTPHTSLRSLLGA